MKRILLILSAALLLGLSLGAQILPYQNPSLSREDRIEDLLSRLTLEEKISLMMNGSAAVDRLGIPQYNWWNEALHGVARAGLATVFPQTIGIAATFDPETQLQTYTYISDEARAKYNDAIAKGQRKQYYGLTFWTPNINIFRDPRWGRGQETYGEDPFLTSQMGMAAVRGLQGSDERYYKTHACAKHFAVHSGPEWNRHEYDASVSARDLWETYLPAFKDLVTKADVREVMGAYNRYEGQPSCANDILEVDILRGKWDYQGMVVSDCSAINDFYQKGHHETHPDAATAAADAVKHGTDVECGSVYRALVESVQRGLITEAEIDVCVRRLLRGRFELGMFDPQSMDPWRNLGMKDVDTPEHNAQALKVARESVVLLKNKNSLLPVKPESVKKIAVIGPNADDEMMMMGNYNGTPSNTVTILEGIKLAYPKAEVTYERGCDLVEGYVYVEPVYNRANINFAEYMGVSEEQRAEMMKKMQEAIAKVDTSNDPKPISSDNYTDEALKALAARAAEADVIYFVGGISPAIEGEEMRGVQLDGFKQGDRERIELPKVQGKVLKALHATGKPVVFILCTGSAIALSENEADYDALICAWYGGQAGGTAVGEILSGQISPSGKLPITFYKSTSQLPDFQNYDMAGRTYRYMTDAPLYPFGYGLSYANIAYGKAKLSAKSISAGESVTINIPLTNKSGVDSDEVVEVYVKRLNDPEAPLKSLKGFKRTTLKAGQKTTVSIELTSEAFEYYDANVDDLTVKTGSYQILYGSSSADKDLKALSLQIK